MSPKLRNPFPVPDVSSEGFWIPNGPVLGGNVSMDDRNWSTKLKTHERLFAHHTLNSVRRDHRLVRSKVPNDALDFSLSSTYIHSEDTMVPKMYVSMQPESLNEVTWRVLRNELQTNSGQMSSMGGKPKHKDTSKHKKSGGSKKTSGSAGGGSHARSTGGSHARSSGKSVGKSTTRSSAKSKSSGRKGAKEHSKDDGEDDDDVLDKEQRRTTFAAQMMAIERVHPSSLKLAIDGPHTDQTNPGFSRKINGTFYSI